MKTLLFLFLLVVATTGFSMEEFQIKFRVGQFRHLLKKEVNFNFNLQPQSSPGFPLNRNYLYYVGIDVPGKNITAIYISDYNIDWNLCLDGDRPTRENSYILSLQYSGDQSISPGYYITQIRRPCVAIIKGIPTIQIEVVVVSKGIENQHKIFIITPDTKTLPAFIE